LRITGLNAARFSASGISITGNGSKQIKIGGGITANPRAIGK
jgi:hypothetical protein